MGDERIRTLGDAWQHATAMRTGLILSPIVGISCSPLEGGGEMVFRHGVAVYAVPRRNANPARS